MKNTENNEMQAIIYAKKKTTKDGKAFYIYLTTLNNKKTGEAVKMRVRFRQECGQPDPHTCPRIIKFSRHDANVSAAAYQTDEGETRISQTLWIAKWNDAGEYVDESLNDFE